MKELVALVMLLVLLLFAGCLDSCLAIRRTNGAILRSRFPDRKEASIEGINDPVPPDNSGGRGDDGIYFGAAISAS